MIRREIKCCRQREEHQRQRRLFGNILRRLRDNTPEGFLVDRNGPQLVKPVLTDN
ncbi:hypothetical protein GJAV_G00064750 [Gymnothorax javanicus]|nr:hypothetical protein GJAV_G00064750 [Gymnothorax javanicus]